MQVRMKMQILPPAMEDGEEADFHAEAFRVAGDGEQCPGSGAEQNVVDGGFVVEGDAGDGFRDSEDDVKVFHRQQLGLPLFKPMGARQPLALGAMTVAARAVFFVTVSAVAAPFGNTAQRWCAADFDSPHQRLLMPGQIVRLAVSGAVLPEDVGQLQGWLGHGRLAQGAVTFLRGGRVVWFAVAPPSGRAD